MNDLLLYSSDQVDFNAERVLGSGMKTPRNASSKRIPPKSSERQCVPVCSPSVSGKKLGSRSIAETRMQSDSSPSLTGMMGYSAGNDATFESFSM